MVLSYTSRWPPSQAHQQATNTPHPRIHTHRHTHGHVHTWHMHSHVHTGPCMHVYTYCTHAHTHIPHTHKVYMHMGTAHTWRDIHTFLCTFTVMHMHLHACQHTCTPIKMCVNMTTSHACTHAHSCAFMHACIHTCSCHNHFCVHTYTCAYTCSLSPAYSSISPSPCICRSSLATQIWVQTPGLLLCMIPFSLGLWRCWLRLLR